MNLLTLIIYEPHWAEPIDSQVRSVQRSTEYRHKIVGRGLSQVARTDYLIIKHADGEDETYRLWPETQFYILLHDPQEVVV